MIPEILKPEQAAAVMGIRPQAVRERMKSGAWDIGTCQRLTGKNRSYDIFRSKLEALIGRELDESDAIKIAQAGH